MFKISTITASFALAAALLATTSAANAGGAHFQLNNAPTKFAGGPPPNVRDHRGGNGAPQGGVSVGPARGNGLCRHERCLYGDDHADHRLPHWGYVRDHRD
jgi:hypothetical protein